MGDLFSYQREPVYPDVLEYKAPDPALRPRVAELHRAGARRKNASGMSATVWRAAVARGLGAGGANG